MKRIEILTVLMIFTIFQYSALAQNTPVISISCDQENEASEKSKYNLEYENVSYVLGRNGNEKSAIKFDGQSFIKVNKDINPAVMPNLTVSFWAKPDLDNKRMAVFSHDDGGFDRSVAIDDRADGGDWKWTAYCNEPKGGARINKSKWSFVAVVFDQNNEKVLIFVDGKTYEHKGSASEGLDYLHFGNNPSFGEPYFGSIDDIKIFDKSLTGDELASLFKSEGGVIDNSEQYSYQENSGNADIVVRAGDVDNLGFGWPKGFDPFCGKNTSVHKYPWKMDENDYPGTDKIMVVSSYESGRDDGYTSNTSRPENIPTSIDIEYKKPDIEINKVVIQMMLDDFQAPHWGTSFQFHINGKRLTYVEDVINKLEQTGPTGKLVQVGILPEDNKLFSTGDVSIKIDDPITGAGDGYAIDFIQIMINPKGEYKCVGNISGVVKDEEGNELTDVLISANGLKENLSDSKGHFKLNAVPIGMITATANKEHYLPGSVSFELKKDQHKQLELILKKKSLETEEFVSEELEEKGFVNLYGIHFDSGKDTPTNDSEATLNELADFLKNNNNLKIQIIGHTDSDGDRELNNDLSLRRAQSVIQWLKEKQVDVSGLSPKGLGESSPVANNNTDAGKALNRRVEIRILP